SERTSSVAGLTVLNELPVAPETNSPPMNSPYVAAMSTIERDSGAGAYSNAPRGLGKVSLVDIVDTVSRASVYGHVVRPRVGAGGDLLPLQQQVVQQAGRPQPKPAWVQPGVAGGLVHQHEISEGVPGGADPASRLHPHL